MNDIYAGKFYICRYKNLFLCEKRKLNNVKESSEFRCFATFLVYPFEYFVPVMWILYWIPFVNNVAAFFEGRWWKSSVFRFWSSSLKFCWVKRTFSTFHKSVLFIWPCFIGRIERICCRRVSNLRFSYDSIGISVLCYSFKMFAKCLDNSIVEIFQFRSSWYVFRWVTEINRFIRWKIVSIIEMLCFVE